MSSARSATIAANRSSRLGPDVASKTRAPGFRSSAAKPGNSPGRATAPLPSHPDLGDEPRELRVGEPVLFDREGLDMPIMGRPLVWVELLRAHFEDSIEQLDQVRQRAHPEDASCCASRWLAGLRRTSPHRCALRSSPIKMMSTEDCVVVRTTCRESSFGGAWPSEPPEQTTRLPPRLTRP